MNRAAVGRVSEEVDALVFVEESLGENHARFLDAVEAFRGLQASLCVVAPPAAFSAELAEEFRQITAKLAKFQVPNDEQYVRLSDLPGRNHPVVVPWSFQQLGERTMVASVEFTEAHLGGNGAVHGGVIPLLFDDLLGIFVSRKGQEGSRTAYLKTNYRKITPIGKVLRVEASIDSIEGRKTMVSGRLFDGEHLLVDAEALFVRLLPGQP
ncbi:PaaI family thioesterase [Nocardia globerula]|nr:PaaI family thioesterase [Nocardia globerula]